MKKILCFLISMCLILNINLMAHATSNIENSTEISAQAEETVENILNEFNNNSDELQNTVDNVIETNSDHPIVKLFKTIIDAIAKLLDAIFDLAMGITKIR